LWWKFSMDSTNFTWKIFKYFMSIYIYAKTELIYLTRKPRRREIIYIDLWKTNFDSIFQDLFCPVLKDNYVLKPCMQLSVI
jgi:hypothetical protein